MREVSDGLDIVMGILAMIILLTVCLWSVNVIRHNSDVAVTEKTSIHNVFGRPVEKPVQSAKDALLSLVVNDAYVPDPATVIFQMGRESYTIVFDTTYFKEKEAAINKAWNEFFRDKMDATIESTELDPSGARWIVKLVS